jgi:tetratricopeptide (TPR) repeat protein
MNLRLRFLAFRGPSIGTSVRNLSCIFALMLAAALPARTQTRDENMKRCMSAHPEISISGCTALIQSGHESPANLSDAYYKRGQAYYDNYKDELAIADYEKAIDLKSNFPEAYSDLCQAETKRDLLVKAIADCTIAITIKTDYAEAYTNRCEAYYHKGLHDQAIADCSQAIALKPNYAAAFGRRAQAYHAKGEDDKALHDAEQTLALAPSGYLSREKTLVQAKAHETLAEIYEKLGQRDKAIAHYIAFCGSCPWVVEDLKRLGGPTADEVSEVEKVNNARSWENLALLAVKVEDWNIALENLLVAQHIDPKSPSVLFNLGLTSEKIPGHELRAIAWFQAYLLAAPASPDATAVRNEVTRLEVAYGAKNRQLLDQFDSLIVLAQKNIAQLTADGSNQQWADAARSILGVAAEFQAGSHYYAGDEPAALHILHVADEKTFQAGRLVIPALDSSNMSHAMVSAGFGIEPIVNGDKSGEFGSGELEALDYLLEAGDLLHAWTLMKGWKPNDDLWMVGMERFLCTAHDRPSGLNFAQASADVEKAIAGMADTRGYYSLIRLYLEMGEVAHAEALAKALPGGAYPVAGLIEDFHQKRIQSHGTCPERLLIFTTYGSSDPQKLHWGFGQSDRGRGMPLWWSTGRMAFLSEIGSKGLQESFDAGWDETRLGEYVKKVGDEILADPYAIKNNTMELTRVEFLISEAYRRVRGPVLRKPDPSR